MSKLIESLFNLRISEKDLSLAYTSLSNRLKSLPDPSLLVTRDEYFKQVVSTLFNNASQVIADFLADDSLNVYKYVTSDIYWLLLTSGYPGLADIIIAESAKLKKTASNMFLSSSEAVDEKRES